MRDCNNLQPTNGGCWLYRKINYKLFHVAMVQGGRCRLNLKGAKYRDFKNTYSPEKVSTAPTRPYPEPRLQKQMFGYNNPSCLRKLIVLRVIPTSDMSW